MKKYICDKCKKEIEEVQIAQATVRLSVTAVEHYQEARLFEYHFHRHCWDKIRDIFN